MSDALAVARRRLTRMLFATAACALLAVGCLTGYFALHQGWRLPAFVLAMLGGVGAQVWFIATWAKAPPPG